MTKRAPPAEWRDLQEAVAQVLADDGYTVHVEQRLTTARSSVTFDVFARKPVGGHDFSIAVECKQWRKNVPQAVVHAFRSQVDDLGADAGYIVSAAGFQSGAYEAAENTSIRLLIWEQFLTKFAPDGPPLAPGLKGSAQVVCGSINFVGGDGEVLPWASSVVTGGTVKRDQAGALAIFIKTESPMPGMQKANAQIGWEGFELTSTSDAISTDPNLPTVLRGQTEFTTPAGMQGPHPLTGAIMTFPVPIDCRLMIQAEGYLKGDTFTGTWSMAAHSSLLPRQAVPLRGSFWVRLLCAV
ncbi:restriction endonuclease [Piscinibacter sp. XHJ-5]|uniref:restriction endonuclease n=1 Tax=Piscinibacter sp. XHJ-5 TaxID=3037797 RepID=UPI0024530649|nr:restriction endonuclease [Piscinibacter sp. XHJ-5]